MIIIDKNQKAQSTIVRASLRKQWQAPQIYMINHNSITSGGVPGGVEGALTPHASPPFTSGSVYHS
jgi:hypothetical protein